MSTEKKDKFSNMYEKRDIVDFIKEVEKHSCLYDRSPDSMNRVLTLRAWREIASVSNSTVTSCKARWKTIRAVFTKAIKQSRSSNPPSRPYYLSEHLQFLLPFIKVYESNREGSPSSPEPESDNERLEIDIPENSEEKFDYERFNNEDGPVNDSPKTVQNGIISVVPIYKINTSGKRSNADTSDECPRKMFLMSIIPDIDSFTDSEMRVFRRDVVNVIDKIFNERKLNNKT